MHTFRLLFWSAAAYAVLLILVRGTFPSESTPTISLTGVPLIVIVVLLTRELAGRSTSPSVRKNTTAKANPRENPVGFLSSQFRVAITASNSYFENIARARLKELLTTKVALEIGLENEKVRQILSDPRQGPLLLGDERLYRMLYGPTPQGGMARIDMIRSAIDSIGAWKG